MSWKWSCNLLSLLHHWIKLQLISSFFISTSLLHSHNPCLLCITDYEYSIIKPRQFSAIVITKGTLSLKQTAGRTFVQDSRIQSRVSPKINYCFREKILHLYGRGQPLILKLCTLVLEFPTKRNIPHKLTYFIELSSDSSNFLLISD